MVKLQFNFMLSLFFQTIAFSHLFDHSFHQKANKFGVCVCVINSPHAVAKHEATTPFSSHAREFGPSSFNGKAEATTQKMRALWKCNHTPLIFCSVPHVPTHRYTTEEYQLLKLCRWQIQYCAILDLLLKGSFHMPSFIGSGFLFLRGWIVGHGKYLWA